MPRHLLLVDIGPVQTFIAQARRTRDLWLGSALLSSVSRAAAEAILATAGAVLIFPAVEGDKVPDGIANKILALVQGEPGEVARAAREAARKHLADRWDMISKEGRVKKSVSGLSAPSFLVQQRLRDLLQARLTLLAVDEVLEV